MALLIRTATENDLPQLALFNRQLIEDEGSRNPMNLSQLEDRLRAWLHSNWQIQLFSRPETPDQVIGYAVFQLRQDEYFPEKQTVYLRQMFICREQRSRGQGREALEEMLAQLIPPGCPLEIDVLASNPRGEHFWRSMGFQAQYTHMVLKQE